MRWQRGWFVGVALGVVGRVRSGGVVAGGKRPAPGSVAVSGGARTGRGGARRPVVRRQDRQDVDQSDRADQGRPGRRRRTVRADPCRRARDRSERGDGAAGHDRCARARRPEPSERVGRAPHDDHGPERRSAIWTPASRPSSTWTRAAGSGPSSSGMPSTADWCRGRGCRWPVNRSTRARPRPAPNTVPGFYSGFTDGKNINGPWLARAAVRELKLHGTDWAKIYTTQDFVGDELNEFRPDGSLVAIPSLTLEEIQAIVDESHRMGLKVACHTYGGEGMRSCVQAGVDLPMHMLELYKDDATLKMVVQKKLPVMMTIDDLAGHEAEDKRLSGGKATRLGLGEQTFRKLLAAGVPLPFGSGAVPGRYPHGRQADQFPYLVKWGMTPVTGVADRLHHGGERLELRLGGPCRKPGQGHVRGSDRGVRRSAGGHHRDAAREVRDEGRSGGPQRGGRRDDSSARAEPRRFEARVEVWGLKARTWRGGLKPRATGLASPAPARVSRVLPITQLDRDRQIRSRCGSGTCASARSSPRTRETCRAFSCCPGCRCDWSGRRRRAARCARLRATPSASACGMSCLPLPEITYRSAVTRSKKSWVVL